MSLVKDVIDLLAQLANHAKDRKTAAEINAIQTLILRIQSEQADLHSANASLRDENLTQKSRIRALEAQIAGNPSPTPPGPEGVPTCPNCSTSATPIYMNSLPPDFAKLMNATHRCSQCHFTR